MFVTKVSGKKEEGEETTYYFKALATKVLVVAVCHDRHIVNDWAAYIDAVEGISHQNEFWGVARYGAKLDHQIAKILFPELDKKYIWRD